MKLIKLIFFAFVICLLSCDFGKSKVDVIYLDESDLWLRREFYPNGVVKVEHTYKIVNKDSTYQHGYLSYFYPDGSLEYSASIENDHKIGTVYKYYESGKENGIYFYNPIGNLLYSIEYDLEGNIIQEKFKENRQPQVILKDFNIDSIELKIYSVDIPKQRRNIYLIKRNGEIIDSIKGSSSQFEKFVIQKDTNIYQIDVDYYDSKQNKFIETNQVQFIPY
jgi:antitoxin component YwqK of YwqJK toxin-antitoxin module